jgi:DNA-binding NtrC family response regulator
LLFRKFASDFAEKYRMPSIRLSDDAVEVLNAYHWPGNIRQLKNLVEQISVIEQERDIDGSRLQAYLPQEQEFIPSIVGNTEQKIDERELMYKFLFDMKNDLNELKKLVVELLHHQGDFNLSSDQAAVVNRIYQDINIGEHRILPPAQTVSNPVEIVPQENEVFQIHEEVNESLSLEDQEKELILKALEKHRGKRKYAADELGISERTLYRKIKEYDLQR